MPPPPPPSFRYINFGAFSLNYLGLSQRYAEYTDPKSVDKFDAQIALINDIMQVLTFALFLSFGAVVLKKAFLKARSTSLDDICQQAVRSFARLRGAAAEAPRIGDASGARGSGFAAENPMRRSDPETAIEMRTLARRPDCPLSVEAEFNVLAEPPLPRSWTRRTTSEGTASFFNEETGASSWTRPKAIE